MGMQTLEIPLMRSRCHFMVFHCGITAAGTLGQDTCRRQAENDHDGDADDEHDIKRHILQLYYNRLSAPHDHARKKH